MESHHHRFGYGTLSLPALAQDTWPSRPIRLVVGFGAGGPTDIPARHVADKLGTALGQRMIVENKPAAAGMLATRDVLCQPADGYNLLFCTHFESINTAVYKNPGFKLADLAPISLVAKYYYGIALSNSIPAEDFEAVRAIRQGPSRRGDLCHHWRRLGAGDHGAAAREDRRHLDEPHPVPRRTAGGAGDGRRPGELLRLADHRGGAAVSKSSSSFWRPPARRRITSTPDVPTLKEKGIDYVRFGWLGFCAPKGTPQPIIDRLNQEIGKIVAMPDYRDLIEKGGSLPEA